MIDKFGLIMVYVKEPRTVADFWIDIMGFKEVQVETFESKVLSVQLTPKEDSDTNLVLFDRAVVEQMSPEVNLGTPSILFSTYNFDEMRENLIENNVSVGEIIEMNGQRTFNFPDVEGNYFAVRDIENH